MGGKELAYIQKAFDSNYIAPLGPMVDAFEKAFAEAVGILHMVALSSGTAAMHLALRNLNVGPGDEVFASTLTFIGSVSPIVFQGATPVFIDADPATWNMDPDLLREELARCSRTGKLPKAVIPTDLYGQCADYERLLAVCRPYGIPVIADAAESLGATCNGGCAGTGAKAAIYSFNGNKIITTSGGGMLASSDPEFIERARFLSQQARDPAPHYEHSTIGYNYRMSNIVAAIGMGQLEALEARVQRKRELFEEYRQRLADVPGIAFMPEADYGRSNRWLTVILVSPEAFGANREAIRLALEKENIESRPVWKPMHRQPAFTFEVQRARLKAVGEKIDSCRAHTAIGMNRPIRARAVGGAVAEDLFERGLCLPSGTAMSKTDLERVIRIIKGCRRTGRLIPARSPCNSEINPIVA
jgi:dTDP-4-amino-4,6-dideoxygalactose transaminase